MRETLTKRKSQAMQTKALIFRTTLQLAKDNGFENVTIEDICTKAGISVGAIYHYFRSKQAILFEASIAVDALMQPLFENKLESESAIDQIAEYLNNYFEYHLELGVTMVSILCDPHNTRYTEPPYPRLVLNEVIEKGQESNEIRKDMSADEIIRYLFIMARGILLDWCQHEGKYSLLDYSQQMSVRLIAMFKP